MEIIHSKHMKRSHKMYDSLVNSEFPIFIYSVYDTLPKRSYCTKKTFSDLSYGIEGIS